MDMERSFTYLAFGLSVAWVVLVIYVITIVNREKKLRKEMDTLRSLVEDKERK